MVPVKLRPVTEWPRPAKVPLYAALPVPKIRMLLYFAPPAAPVVVKVLASMLFASAKFKLLLLVQLAAVAQYNVVPDAPVDVKASTKV